MSKQLSIEAVTDILEMAVREDLSFTVNVHMRDSSQLEQAIELAQKAAGGNGFREAHIDIVGNVFSVSAVGGMSDITLFVPKPETPFTGEDENLD